MKKRISLIVAVVMVLSLLCTSALAESHLSVAWWGNQTRNERTQAVLDMYTEKFGTTCEAIMNSWDDYWTSLATASAGGQLPDLMQHSTTYIQQYVDNGLLLNLAPYIESGALDVTNIGDSILDLGRVNDGIYGICVGTNGLACLYNKTALDAAGIVIKDLMTVEEFMAVCKEVYEKTGYKTDMGFGTESMLSYLARGLGKALFVDGKLGVTQEDMAYVYGMYERGLAEGWALGADVYASLVIGSVEQNPLVYGSDPSTMSWCAFAWTNQMTAMQAAAPEGMTLGLTTMPSPDPVKSNWLACSQYFTISSKTADPDEAVKFLNYFINDIDAGKVLLIERGIPVSSAVNDAIAGDLDESSKGVVSFVSNVVVPNSSAVPAPDPAGAGEIFAYHRELQEMISYGEITADEAASLFIETAEEILDR